MFGLFGGGGMSEKDKWHLNQTELMMEPIAKRIGQDPKAMAKEFFEAEKDEVIKRYKDSAYAQNIGERLVASQKEMVAKRVAAGLTLDDIRGYWNQTPLMLNIQNKLMEMGDYIELNVAQQMGKSMDDLERLAAGWRKTKPRWGDPEQWDASLPVNQGFTAEDADLFIEFYLRVSRWQAQTSEARQAALLKNYTSYNAMLRDLARQGTL